MATTLRSEGRSNGKDAARLAALHGPRAGGALVIGTACALAVLATTGRSAAQDTREHVASGAGVHGARAAPQGPPDERAGADGAEVSGTILVDGEPPEWPVHLYLHSAFHLSQGKQAQPPSFSDSIIVAPAERGAFSFQDVPREKLRLFVSDFHFAGGSSNLVLDGPATGLVLQLEAKPEIVGRLLDPEGRPAPNVQGSCWLRVGTSDDAAPRSFSTRSDGRFRVPGDDSGEPAALALRVQAGDAYLCHETPVLARPPRVDLGDFRLEPARTLRFTVRDPDGRPIPFAFAELDDLRSSANRPRLTLEGSGILEAVPARLADVRFGAHRYADRVLPVGLQEAIEVTLERRTTLEVRLLDPCTDHVVLVAERPAFDWDTSRWDEGLEHRDRHHEGASFLRLPSATERRFAYWIAPRDATLALVDLTPDLAFTLEARDVMENVLATSTLSVPLAQHRALALGTPDPAGELPRFRGQSPKARPGCF